MKHSPRRADSRPVAPLPVNPVAVRRVEATCRERSYEVVPSAIDADFDYVAGELLMSIRELREPFRRIDDTPVVVPELITVDIPNPAKRIVRADGTGGSNLITDVSTGPYQFGVRVADVPGVERPASEARQSGPTCEAVVHGRGAQARRRPCGVKGPTGGLHRAMVNPQPGITWGPAGLASGRFDLTVVSW
jgi:hypothetical protein